MCIIAKFGGTSLRDAPAIRQAIHVLRHHSPANVIVASALSGVTSALLTLADDAANHRKEEVQSRFEIIELRHQLLANQIKVSEEVRSSMDSLLKEMRMRLEGMALLQEVSVRSMDLLLTTGERLSSLLFAEALNQEGITSVVVDARQLIITNDHHGQAEPDTSAIQKAVNELIVPHIEAGTVVVTQGFIGATREGVTTTLGRGGSDYSAALLAEALNAEELKIWTDVAGIYSCDPSVVKNSQPLPELSFCEAAEMATFGAKVLHPATLWPAVRQDIPVFVGSTFAPEKGGTWIRNQVDDSPLVRAVVVRRNQTLLTATNLKMFHARGFLAQFFEVLARHNLSVDLVTTSQVKVSITIDNPEHLNDKVLRELQDIAQIEVEENLALIGIIGHGLTREQGFISQAFSSLHDNIIRLICCGASERNVCFLVDEEYADEVVRNVHGNLIENNEYCGVEVETC
jgi:aspartate kinase